MTEFINQDKIKGFIRQEIDERFKKINKEIEKMHNMVSKLREEMYINRMKGGKID